MKSIGSGFAGPLLTLAVLLIIRYLPGLGFTAALAFIPLVWSAYRAGLFPAMASSVIIAIFAAAIYPPDYSRTVQVIITAVLISLMVGYLKHHAELSQSLNGNLKRLRESLELVRRLKYEWADLSDSGRYKLVDAIENKLAQLATLVWGWHSIRVEIDETREELGLKELDSDGD